MVPTNTNAHSPSLWEQARHDPATYVRLLREHGLLPAFTQAEGLPLRVRSAPLA